MFKQTMRGCLCVLRNWGRSFLAKVVVGPGGGSVGVACWVYELNSGGFSGQWCGGLGVLNALTGEHSMLC